MTALSTDLSRAETASLSVPAPEGLEYMPFQKAGIAYAQNRDAVLIGDEMGLGKTIQAIGVINLDDSIESVLVICPASLKLNWQRELEKWLVRPMGINIVDPQKGYRQAGIIIINYDILRRFHDELHADIWDLLIVDESHFLKNKKAQRTKEVVGTSNQKRGKIVRPIRARKRLLLTGTPILNRPKELWTSLHYLDPINWPNWWRYVNRYCDAKQGRWGMDIDGSSNLGELQDRLRSTVMVRRLKKDVLKDLPAKIRQIVDLPTKGSTAAIKAEHNAWQNYQETISDTQAIPDQYAEAVENMPEPHRVAFAEISKARRDTAVAKIPQVIEYLKNALEMQKKVILFAHHHGVIEAVREEFGASAVVVYGPTSLEDRQKAVDAFQGDPAITLFIGSIKAAGVGLTLTAASHVVFAELDWVPGTITQAEDRCHRIGQSESVLIQHLVFAGSLDANMARTLVSKQAMIDSALDEKPQAYVPQEPFK